MSCRRRPPLSLLWLLGALLVLVTGMAVTASVFALIQTIWSH